MQCRRAVFSAMLAIVVVGPAGRVFAAEAPSTQGPSTAPLATQPVIPSDRASIREMIALTGGVNPVKAADAAVKLKLLARRGVPVWEDLEEGDSISARQLLTWLRDHPGHIHHPSSLRPRWYAMDLFVQDISSGKVSLMGGNDLIEYAELAREMLRDGDPYGYYALLDVCRAATELLGGTPDPVTTAYVMPMLDGHLSLRVPRDTFQAWKGYWAKPITQERKYPSPAMPHTGLQPQPPTCPWSTPARLLLPSLAAYRVRLTEMGLWETPPWEKTYTEASTTTELLHAMADECFPARQHVSRLLRERLGNATVRKQVFQAIRQDHPRARVLDLLLGQTTNLVYAEALRKVWPAELTVQCPGLLEDLISTNPRRQHEGATVLQPTLLYWPDRAWANRTAVAIWKATGQGATDISIVALLTVDNREGVECLLATYRKGDVPDAVYNALHRWANTAAGDFRTACADKDLAPVMLKLSTASQPAADTSKSDWPRILRLSYDLVWWDQNKDQLYWSEKNHRLEVPAAQLRHPTEEEILAGYKDRGALLRRMIEDSHTRTVNVKSR